MAKVMKSHTLLADKSGAVWVEAELSQAQVKRVINSYKRAGIDLTPYGSPDQLTAQLKQINAVLDTNATARAMREQGRLIVVGAGF
jgi:hypothetical protein